MLMKQILKFLNKKKDVPFSGWKIQHNKDVNSPQIAYRFNAISFKIPANIFIDIDKVILKFV